MKIVHAKTGEVLTRVILYDEEDFDVDEAVDAVRKFYPGKRIISRDDDYLIYGHDTDIYTGDHEDHEDHGPCWVCDKDY